MRGAPTWTHPPRGAVRRAAPSCERGSATVLGLGVIALVLTMWIAALVLGAVVLGSGRARTAADLAAVGGAQVLLHGAQESAACTRAAEVAQANGADLTSCSVSVAVAGQGPSIEVIVQVATGLSSWPAVRARAHAGLVPGQGRLSSAHR